MSLEEGGSVLTWAGLFVHFEGRALKATSRAAGEVLSAWQKMKPAARRLCRARVLPAGGDGASAALEEAS